MAPDFADAAHDIGFTLDDLARRRFTAYRDVILAAAARFSLTAVRTPEAIERRHFLESLAVTRLLADRGLLGEGARVLDIGSGAGVPGLPLKIVRPDLRLSLLEANVKRCRFLRETITALGLEVEVLEGRAETLAQSAALRETFDLVLARAVAPLPVLLEYALPFLRRGGHLAAAKGSGAARELRQSRPALAALGGEARAVLPLDLADLPLQSLIIVEKVIPTPAHFPRRSGLPAKRPLA